MIPKLALFATLAILALPLASAQSPEEPLIDHVDVKTAAASGDPVGFAQDHASEEAVAREAEWGVAYACFGAHYAHDEVGTPDPQLEQCEDYEEVLGIAPEPEEPVAVVQNLSEDPVAQVQEIEEEVIASVDDIVEDPLSAPEILIGLVLYLVDKVLDLIGGVGATATGIAGEALDLVGAALAADVKLGASIYDGPGQAASAGIDGVVAVVTGTLDGVGHGAKSTADAIGDAAAAVGHAVSDFVGGLFGDEEKASGGDSIDDAAGDVTDKTDGLLDLVGDVADGVKV